MCEFCQKIAELEIDLAQESELLNAHVNNAKNYDSRNEHDKSKISSDAAHLSLDITIALLARIATLKKQRVSEHMGGLI